MIEYATMDEMKDEAVYLMRAFKMFPKVIDEFRIDLLNCSETYGALYWLNEKRQSAVREWERETGNLVYHVIYNRMEFGELLTMLYVDKDKRKWQRAREDAAAREPFACCVLIGAPETAEYGQVGVRPMFGGLVRVW